MIASRGMWTIYRHTKGMHYLSLGQATHSETLEPLEVYRALYDNELASMWVRPHGMFHGPADAGGKRFEVVGRVRVVYPEDEATVLGFGHDAWGHGLSVTEFVSTYSTNLNHLRGTRYLFELPSGEIVGNLNTIRFCRSLVGLASMSVAPSVRRRGIASLLLRAVIELFRAEDPATRFILYSEVGLTLYERIGFSALPTELQFHPPAVAMVTGEGGLSDDEAEFLWTYF
jgi:GNAT superfamily N-acetyltransferase